MLDWFHGQVRREIYEQITSDMRKIRWILSDAATIRTSTPDRQSQPATRTIEKIFHLSRKAEQLAQQPATTNFEASIIAETIHSIRKRLEELHEKLVYAL